MNASRQPARGVIAVTALATLAATLAGGGAAVDPSALDWVVIGALVVVLGLCVRMGLSRLQRSAGAAIAIVAGLNVAGQFDAFPVRLASALVVAVCWLAVAWVGWTAWRRSRT